MGHISILCKKSKKILQLFSFSDDLQIFFAYVKIYFDGCKINFTSFVYIIMENNLIFVK